MEWLAKPSGSLGSRYSRPEEHLILTVHRKLNSASILLFEYAKPL